MDLKKLYQDFTTVLTTIQHFFIKPNPDNPLQKERLSQKRQTDIPTKLNRNQDQGGFNNPPFFMGEKQRSKPQKPRLQTRKDDTRNVQQSPTSSSQSPRRNDDNDSDSDPTFDALELAIRFRQFLSDDDKTSDLKREEFDQDKPAEPETRLFTNDSYGFGGSGAGGSYGKKDEDETPRPSTSDRDEDRDRSGFSINFSSFGSSSRNDDDEPKSSGWGGSSRDDDPPANDDNSSSGWGSDSISDSDDYKPRKLHLNERLLRR